MASAIKTTVRKSTTGSFSYQHRFVHKGVTYAMPEQNGFPSLTSARNAARQAYPNAVRLRSMICAGRAK